MESRTKDPGQKPCMHKLFIQYNILTNLLLNIYFCKKPVIYLLSFITFKPKIHLINK